jgi:DNA-binding NarL/FixJ family response regulator
MKRLRILLADDHALILGGVKALLEPHHDVVGECRDGAALVKAVRQLRPDMVILDISMPVLNGIDAARQIHQEFPDIKIVFLSMHPNPIYLRQSLKSGANAYVLKTDASEELVAAIAEVMRGKTYLSSGFDEETRIGLWTRSGELTRAEAGLTDRQKEILQRVASGRTSKEIAAELEVSVKTVEFHRSRLMEKLGVHSTAELTRRAIEDGLIAP